MTKFIEAAISTTRSHVSHLEREPCARERRSSEYQTTAARYVQTGEYFVTFWLVVVVLLHVLVLHVQRTADLRQHRFTTAELEDT